MMFFIYRRYQRWDSKFSRKGKTKCIVNISLIKCILEISILCLSKFNIDFSSSISLVEYQKYLVSFQGSYCMKIQPQHSIIVLSKATCSYAGMCLGPLSSRGQNRLTFSISYHLGHTNWLTEPLTLLFFFSMYVTEVV